MAVQRRKKLLLQLSRKMEAIDLINKGKPLALIAWAYGVGVSTVSNWKKNQYEIQRYCTILHMTQASSVLEERFTMRKPNDQTLDGALYLWYEEALDRGEYITGKVLQEKAKEINLKLTGVDNFSASMGWLTRWKKRHGIVGKFAKKPDERAMVPLPAVEDGEDPLKLGGKEVVLEDGSTKILEANSAESFSESIEVPFQTSSKYLPCALKFKNVEEIMKNSTCKDNFLTNNRQCSGNESTDETDKCGSEVDFHEPDDDRMEEVDSFLNSSTSQTHRASPSSSDVANASSGRPSEMYEIVDSSDEESLPAPLCHSMSSAQRGTPRSSCFVDDDPHVGIAVQESRPEPASSEVYEIVDSDEEDVNTAEQRETTAESDLVYLISDDSEEEEGIGEVEMEVEEKEHILTYTTYKSEEDSSSR